MLNNTRWSMTMSLLNSLKLVTAKKPVQTPIAVKRTKLLTKLQDQIDLMSAQQQGKNHHVVRTQWVTDTDSGARVAVEVHKRVREWFWQNSTGRLTAVIKYGAATLALGKGGKNAFEVSDVAELIAAFNAIKSAVIAGELDDAIADASVRTRKGFGK
jgi:hypothetical protein